MLKQKLYSAINIGGLAIGLTAFILISLYIQHEWSYDRFLPGSENIYRIYSQQKGNNYLGSELFAVTPAALASTLVDEYPEIVHASALKERSALLSVENEHYMEEGLLADRHFFDVLPYTLVEGDPETCLKNPQSIVLTQSLAVKIFGKEAPLNRALVFQNGETYSVTGIVQDPPITSSLKFSFIASLISNGEYTTDLKNRPWSNNSYLTFFSLRPDADPIALQNKLPAFLAKHRKLEESYPFKDSYYVQALWDFHLESRINFDMGIKGNRQYIQLFSLVAFLVLILACMNYMNLAIARSMGRAKEVGLRKVIGARKSQLIGQFFGESLLVTFFALILAIGGAHLLAPFFGTIVERPIELNPIQNPFLLPGLLLLTLCVGLIAGSYPALVVSSFQPLKVLKGNSFISLKGMNLQRLLIVFQYAVSIALVIASIVLFQQFQFIQTKELGFEKEHIVTIPVSFRDGELRENIDQIAVSMQQNSLVEEVTACSSLPIHFDSSTLIKYQDDLGQENETSIYRGRVDYSYIPLFGLELIAGRNFSPDFSTDKENKFILNETAAKVLGWTAEEAIGKEFTLYGDETGTVIGVVKDFHMHSMHMKIEPLMLVLRREYFNHVAVKIKGLDIPGTLKFIESSIAAYSNYPVHFQFMDEGFDRLYQTELRLGKIFGFFTFLAVLIASMGLFGLAVLNTKRKSKEIGIRKVLGASVQHIVGLISQDFLKLVAAGFLLAIPVAWYIMSRWLESFAYKIELKAWVFAATGLAALFVAFFTISVQTLSAAFANPVESLKDE